MGDVPRLVVLPFENLGAAEDEYFADGMTEEITSRLAQIPSLAVIGRTSAMQYKGAGKSLRTIGEELQVQYVLDGTVRWSREGEERRLRITPQLIRVADEAHVWADRYDAVFADVFAVQGRIAAQVVTALGATLGRAAAADVAAPTRNEAAYEEYLLGNALYSQCFNLSCSGYRQAAEHYEEAVRLDPGFAAAWARLTLALQLADFRVALPRAVDAARRALDLAPNLAEAHLALGILSYFGPVQERDDARAERAFRRALDLQPNHPEGLRLMGLVLRRQGDTQRAAEVLARHAELDPRDARAQYDAGITYARLQLPDQAERYLERHLALQPGSQPGLVNLAVVHLMRGGDSAAARRVVMRGRGEGVYDLYLPLGFIELGRLLCNGCADAAREWLARRGPPPDDSVAENGPVMTRGRVAQLAGDSDLARSYLQEATRRVQARIVTDLRGEPGAHQDLAVISAWLGRKDAAVGAAREAVRLAPVSQNMTGGPGALNTLAEVYAIFGDDELALEQLETLLSIPSPVSAPVTRVNPVWRRFHGNPRFEALLAKYETASNK